MEKAKAKIVIGLGFGDEGKGKVVSNLCLQKTNLLNPIIVRSSGGQQAGHTVYYQGKNHVFSNFGSGTLSRSKTYFTKYCTIDPVGIFNEFCVLKSKMSESYIELYIDKNCPVTTPYDIAYNRIHSRYLTDGTCGVGVGQTWQREEDHYSLKASDLMNKTIRDIKLECIKKYYTKLLNTSEVEISDFLNACRFIEISESIHISGDVLENECKWRDCIFEGSQGILLDQDHGFFPHVTRSKTDLTNPMEIISSNRLDLKDVYFVTRAYQTRHGNGPMTNDDYVIEFKNDYESNVKTMQGYFRTSILDLDLIKYAYGCAVNGYDDALKGVRKNLVITCLDVVENRPNPYLYTIEGVTQLADKQEDFINAINQIVRADNIYISYSPHAENLVKY